MRRRSVDKIARRIDRISDEAGALDVSVLSAQHNDALILLPSPIFVTVTGVVRAL